MLGGIRRKVGAFIGGFHGGGFEAAMSNRRLKAFQPSRAHLNTLIAAALADLDRKIAEAGSARVSVVRIQSSKGV